MKELMVSKSQGTLKEENILSMVAHDEQFDIIDIIMRKFNSKQEEEKKVELPKKDKPVEQQGHSFFTQQIHV